MATRAAQYFAGMFDVGAEPDWERVAKSVDLLAANDVRIECLSAVAGEGGKMRVPFFARSGRLREHLDGSADPRGLIEAMCPYKLDSYRRLDPKTAGTFALKAMVKLSNDNHDTSLTKPSDLKPRPKPSTDPDDAFKGLIGLNTQRDMLRKVSALVAKHGRDSVECLHMAFTGAPGTGKTELAHRLLAHLDALGVTDGSGTFVKATAADLVAPYMGQTPGRTRAVVERAVGGILFIDEAYSLLSGGDYGQEAIDTLVEMLEAERDKLVCIIAGYPEDIEQLFQRNSGLRDRFGLRVTFDDYTTAELEQVFDLFARHHGCAVDPDAHAELVRCLEGLRNKRDFANARSARRLFDRAAMECAVRCDRPLIESCDLRAAYKQPDLGGADGQRTVGFAG